MKIWVENSQLILGIIAIVAVAVGAIYRFYILPSDKQAEKVREWLIWACIEAEKSLSSGTGQLKLRKVYDAFVSVQSFQWIAKIISFTTFSLWVDIALEKAKNMLVSNPDLATYVYGDKAEEEVSKLKKQIENHKQGE